MSITNSPRAVHFTAFRSAADEVADKRARDQWINEGGHMSAKSGYMVETRSSKQRYKAVLNHELGPQTEHAFSTIREGEAFIRRNIPTPPAPDTSRDETEAFP